MSKVLITGGAGFIGSHISEHFLKKGHTVRILDNFSTGRREKLAFLKQYKTTQYKVIEGDIRNAKVCEQACKGVSVVIHQAACKTVPKSIKDPHLFNDVNINGTLNLLQASVHHNVKRLVFASSSSVYGNSKFFPQRETHLPSPISPYALTKLAGEHYCRVFSHLYGLETICLRYFNVFGPRQDFDDMYSAVIVKFIRMAILNEKLPVFGNGKQSRDFTYIDNVVLGNYLAAFTGKVQHEVFNLATGNNYSILDLVACLNRLTHQKAVLKFLSLRQGDIYKSQSDIAKVRKILKFKPIVSFESGVEKTFHYVKERI